MNKTKRKRTGPLTVTEFAEYLAIKFEDILATLPSEERVKRREALHQSAVEARAKRRRAARTQATQARSSH
jgi:hypothetical protein